MPTGKVEQVEQIPACDSGTDSVTFTLNIISHIGVPDMIKHSGHSSCSSVMILIVGSIKTFNTTL